MHGGKQHTAGLDTHHLARRKVDDRNERLADELFGLVVRMDTGQDDAVGIGAVIERELQQLLGLRHGDAFLHLNSAEV